MVESAESAARMGRVEEPSGGRIGRGAGSLKPTDVGVRVMAQW